jgi:hypothetical protein
MEELRLEVEAAADEAHQYKPQGAAESERVTESDPVMESGRVAAAESDSEAGDEIEGEPTLAS